MQRAMIKRRSSKLRRIEKDILPYFFISPAIILLIILTFIPFLEAIRMSFTACNLFRPGSENRYVGLDNYITMLQNPDFYRVLLNTIVFTIFSITISLLISLVAALALNEKIRGVNVFKTIVLLPWVIPPVAAALIWQQLFDSNFGVINYLLTVTGLSTKYEAFLANPQLVLYSLAIIAVWKYSPFLIVGLLAGLQAIPEHLYEAAKVDGAGRWQRFLNVTLPGIKPILFILLMLQIIWRFNHFDIVWILTGGGPGVSSHLVSTYAYEYAFRFYDFARGSTVAVISLVLILILTYFYVRRTKIW